MTQSTLHDFYMITLHNTKYFSSVIIELQKLGARLRVYTYPAPKTSIRYRKKHAPKINSGICFTKIS